MMRVQILLLALASTPLVAAVGQNGAAAVKDPAQCQVADANRSPSAWSHERPSDPQGRVRVGCSPVTPAQDPPPPPPSGGGTASITGRVYHDVTGQPPLSGWVVTISGAFSASTVTDAQGNYGFSGLPGGTYTVCEVVASGWMETAPPYAAPCPSGVGYTFPLNDGASAQFLYFGNVVM
jgi:hypothetical protein